MLHLVDLSGAAVDPIADYKAVAKELSNYSEQVAAKPKVVVATKIDAIDDKARLGEFRSFCSREGFELYAISAATGNGLPELLRAVASRLGEVRDAEDRAARVRILR